MQYEPWFSKVEAVIHDLPADPYLLLKYASAITAMRYWGECRVECDWCDERSAEREYEVVYSLFPTWRKLEEEDAIGDDLYEVIAGEAGRLRACSEEPQDEQTLRLRIERYEARLALLAEVKGG